METISKLFLLLKNLFFVSKSISQGNVLKSILMDFLIFQTFTIFPVFKSLLWNLLSCSTEHSILRNTSLELFELLFNLMTLSLFLIKLSLKFRGHLVVTILGLFQIYSDLMDVSKSIKIFVLVHLDIWLFVILLKGWVDCDDLFLELLVFSSERILFSKLFFNGSNQISLHFGLTWKFSNIITFFTIFVFSIVFIWTIHIIHVASRFSFSLRLSLLGFWTRSIIFTIRSFILLLLHQVRLKSFLLLFSFGLFSKFLNLLDLGLLLHSLGSKSSVFFVFF